MATNSERREVARRLREIAAENPGSVGSPLRMQAVLLEAQEATGTRDLPDVAHVLLRYAELMDPDDGCATGREVRAPGAVTDPWDRAALLDHAGAIARIVARHTGRPERHVLECVMRVVGHLCETGGAR